MYTMNGAELIVRLMERQGITTVAGIPGGANLPIYDALSALGTIKHILTRHEQGAGFLAQGMARSTGKAAVCIATSGPGATNVLTAIADAYLDSIPLVCFTGQVPSSLIGTDAFQEVDIYGMSIPITKYNFLAHSAKELLTIVPRAFHLAMSGRPGPVLIDVPKDVQQQMVSFEAWPEPGQKDPPLEPSQEGLELAAELLNSSARPVLCLGGGIVNGDASNAAIQLAEKLNIPTCATLMGIGAIPANHPLSLGMLGMHAARSTNMMLQDCDLFIAAGSRFDDRATGKAMEFCPYAKFIHIDIDASEVNKIKVAHVGVVGDVRITLENLLPMVEKRERPQWLGKMKTLQKEHPLPPPEMLSPERPYGIIAEVAKAFGDEAIVATDVGKHQMWTAQSYPFVRARQFLTSGGLGTMGFGLPAAIGASMANPDRKVICFTGDGSLQMNIQEMATAVEQQANVTIVVMNNQALGLVRQLQGLFYKEGYFGSEYQISIDLPMIARGFGMRAYDTATDGSLAEILQSVIKETGPSLININIDREEDVYPMVPPGASNSDMIGGSNGKQ